MYMSQHIVAVLICADLCCDLCYDYYLARPAIPMRGCPWVKEHLTSERPPMLFTATRYGHTHNVRSQITESRYTMEPPDFDVKS